MKHLKEIRMKSTSDALLLDPKTTLSPATAPTPAGAAPPAKPAPEERRSSIS